MKQQNMHELLGVLHRTPGASDLIVTVGTPPQLRVNGMLEPIGSEMVTPDRAQELIYSLLTDRQVEELSTTRFLDFSKGYEEMCRFRFSVYYQKETLGIAARIIPYVVLPFKELGVPNIVKDFAMKPHGLILITGPAGSGKSTTMAAMIDYINERKGVHVVCIEDPIEYVHRHKKSTITQREIGSDARSFTEALRSVFRQTPDVIMIGEMRDLETVQLALTLAETGHLIMGTLHTQDTTHAVNRVVDMFPSNQQEQIYSQLSLVLVGIISQQLLVTSDNTRRVLAYEVMNVNNAIRNLIRENQIQQVYTSIQTGSTEGMRTMNDTLLELYSAGLIDQELALERSPRPKELKKLCGLD